MGRADRNYVTGASGGFPALVDLLIDYATRDWQYALVHSDSTLEQSSWLGSKGCGFPLSGCRHDCSSYCLLGDLDRRFTNLHAEGRELEQRRRRRRSDHLDAIFVLLTLGF